jgi:hypothetical protein
MSRINIPSPPSGSKSKPRKENQHEAGRKRKLGDAKFVKSSEYPSEFSRFKSVTLQNSELHETVSVQKPDNYFTLWSYCNDDLKMCGFSRLKTSDQSPANGKDCFKPQKCKSIPVTGSGGP